MRDRWELGGRKIIGTFRKGEEGIRGRGTLARPTFFEAINAEDRQTERAGIDEKKKRERGKKKVGKTRSPRNANIRVTGARPPGTFENARSCPSTLLRNFFRETRPIERRSKFAKFGNSSLVLYDKKEN